MTDYRSIECPICQHLMIQHTNCDNTYWISICRFCGHIYVKPIIT